jgi:type II secretory pathway pseudopilin PulG
MKFSLLDLIAVTIVIFVLSAVGVKAIQVADEAADRTACTNNIKKLLEGVQNYENAQGYLPPARTQNNHPGWNLRILPYMGYENVHNVLVQNHLYDRDYQGILNDNNAVPVNPYDIGDKNSTGAASTFSGNPKSWYRFTCQTSGNPTDAVTKNDGDGILWTNIHKALSEIPEFRNPGRQPNATIKKITGDVVYSNSFTIMKFDNDQYEQSCMRGAVSDFATAFATFPTALMNYSIGKDGNFLNVTKSNVMDASNIYVLAEKHIPLFALLGDTPISNMWNGGLHRTHATINAFNGSIRYINLETIPKNWTETVSKFNKDGVPLIIKKHPIAVTNNEVENELSFLIGNAVIRYPSNFQTGEYLWGSNNPETLSVGVLDGSVKQINKNIDTTIFNNSWRQQPKKIIFED